MTKGDSVEEISWQDALQKISPVAPLLAESIDRHLKTTTPIETSPQLMRGKYGTSLPPIGSLRYPYVLLVVTGLLEVQDTYPPPVGKFPRFVARPGTLVGVFELLSGGRQSLYTLVAGSSFGFQLPETTDAAFLRMIAGLPQGRKPFEDSDKVDAPKRAVEQRIRTLLGDSLYFEAILIPAMMFAQSTLGWLEVNASRAYLLETAIIDYEHALSRVRADQYRLFEGKPREQQIVNLIEGCFIEHEIIWQPAGSVHRLPTDLVQTGLQVDADQNHFSTKRLVRDSKGITQPVTLLPAVFGWHDIFWGLIPAISTPTAERLNKSLSRKAWHAINDSQGNCVLICDDASAKEPTLRARQSRILRALLETALPNHSYAAENELFAKTLPNQTRRQLRMTVALKSAFFTEHLFAIARRAIPSSEISIIGVQHILRCIHELFLQCKKGKLANDVYLLGKNYSTSMAVAQAMQLDGLAVFPGPKSVSIGKWEDAIREAVSSLVEDVPPGKYIVVDDGGSMLSHTVDMSQEIASRGVVISCGVELTTSGINRQWQNEIKYPIVNVAQSWGKRIFESPLIATALVRRAVETIQQGIGKDRRITIMGSSGPLGKSLFAHLEKDRRVAKENVYPFDVDRSNSVPALIDVIRGSDLIFGCAGTDVFKTIDAAELRAKLSERFAERRTPLIFISCSSGDIEFNSILRLSNQYGVQYDQFPARDIGIDISSASGVTNQVAIVRRGGFPINFDNTQDSVPLPDIRLTTALLACGIVQAFILESMAAPPAVAGIYALHHDLQAVALRHWLLATRFRRKSAIEPGDVYSRDEFERLEEMRVSEISAKAEKFNKDNPSFGMQVPAEVGEILHRISTEVWIYVDALYKEPF